MASISTKKRKRAKTSSSSRPSTRKIRIQALANKRTNELSLAELKARFMPVDDVLKFRVCDTDYDVRLETAASLGSEDFQHCFDTLKANMIHMYKRSELGWSSSEKKIEMKNKAMRYLVLTCSKGNNFDEGDNDIHETSESTDEKTKISSQTIKSEFVGFLSFMVTVEHIWEVVYTYEINILPSHQRRGLGKRLIDVMEHFGRNADVMKSMLTVFNTNTEAKAFYNSIGYSVDEWSPEPKKLRSGEVVESAYEILSKEFKS